MGLPVQKGRAVKLLFVFLLFLSHSTVRADDIDMCRVFDKESVSFQIGSRMETTAAGVELLEFYEDSQCRLVWSDENGLNPQALSLIDAIGQFADEGLDRDDPSYHLGSIIILMDSIKSDFSSNNNPAVLSQLDILLTDGYLMLGKHLYYGLAPRETTVESKKPPAQMGLRLRLALQNNRVKESLKQLSPESQGYQALRNIMVKYIKIQEAGGWKTVDEYSIADLMERLRVEGDLGAGENSPEEYTDALKNFQMRHGIKADGRVGNETLSKLNISPEEKIAAIRLNLERWRWTVERRENFYISVNIPDFSLSAIEEDAAVMKMRAIVGKAERPTPIFSATMNTIVVNPYWRVPKTILQEDIIPEMRKNRRYLKKERIRIFKYGDENGKRAINPASINWKKADADTFPYYLRQDAGPKNSLGRLKFLFPNSHDVYIHDTPYKTLFEKTTRSFSSGCIRIEEPVNFANYLLANDGKDVDIAALMRGRANKTISLSNPVKVYIDYWTVWEDNGTVHFRDDVYGYDGELAEVLGWNRGQN